MHGGVGVVYLHDHGVYALAHVVSGDIRCKTDRYAVCAVYEQIRKSARQSVRLFERIVKVGRPRHRFFVQISQKFKSQRAHSRLGVTHSRRAVAVNRAEVAVTVNKLHSHREGLCHTHHCAVDRAVAVGVILAKAVAHDSCALLVRFVGSQPHLVH